MLAAVTLVLGLTNIGIIPIPPANVTTMHIPVIIGAILCGSKVGLLLGLVFWINQCLESVYSYFCVGSTVDGCESNCGDYNVCRGALDGADYCQVDLFDDW